MDARQYPPSTLVATSSTLVATAVHPGPPP